MEDLANSKAMAEAGFDSFSFEHGAYRHLVFEKGTGPAVVVMHELPGLSGPAVRFAERLVDAGFHVYLPLLFGHAMQDASLTSFARLCISREFARLKVNVSAPVCDWLRGLVRKIGDESPDTKVGVIGMCLTGGFVIPMIMEPALGAGVISQPSVPFSFAYLYLGVGKGDWMYELNVAKAAIDSAVDATKRRDIRLIVQHFKDDRLCPPERVELIKNWFGPCATSYHYPKPSPQSKAPHALLTEEYDKAADDPANSTRVAFQQVVAFLRAQLGTTPGHASVQVHGDG